MNDYHWTHTYDRCELGRAQQFTNSGKMVPTIVRDEVLELLSELELVHFRCNNRARCHY